MRTLTITFPAPGESGLCEVTDEYGRCCNGLCWGEMLEQVASLTMPQSRLGYGYRMNTPDEWQAERDALHERVAARRDEFLSKQERAAEALQRLYDVSAGLDCETQGERPSEAAYQAAMAEAKAALDALDNPF